MYPRQQHPRPQPTPTVRMPQGFAAGAYGDQTTPDERQWALTAYIGQFLFWALPPLYIYLTKRRRSTFAAHHARQALNLALSSGIVFGVSVLVSTQIGTKALYYGFGWVIFSMAIVVFSATRANQGRWHRIPVIFAWPLVK
ncbi:DUF4870 domain-containing protein [Actinocorallia longicatena]|uniref:DUF4870 domain-containing protein n=1 Tax=Actinocorallia longicatena TaxID=111803 RepID=A0ABP6QJ82_9ACTN